MKRKGTPERLRLPDQLTGAFDGIVIGTFGADLAFAERQLFQHLPKSTVNRIILADARQLGRFLATNTDVRRVNRTYVAAPVRSPHAHHPKFLLLVGADEGLLLVGSGNLSLPGYTGPGECFSTYRWSRDEPAMIEAFGAVRELILDMLDRNWIDPIAAGRLHELFSIASWIPSSAGPTSPVVHNFERPLLDQLVARIGTADVSEIVAAAPFHDHGARAIAALILALRPERVGLLVQPRQTRLDIQALDRLRRRTKTPIQLIEAQAPSPYPPTWLHAKFVLVRTKRGDVLLQGSANLTSIAMCESGNEANVELANLLEGPAGEFDALLDALELTPFPQDITAFESAEWDDDDDADSPTPSVDCATWTPPRLRWRIQGRTSGKDIQVHIGDRLLKPIRLTAEHSEGFTMVEMEFGSADALLIDQAPRLKIAQRAHPRTSSIRTT